jgi:hypothetical protein
MKSVHICFSENEKKPSMAQFEASYIAKPTRSSGYNTRQRHQSPILVLCRNVVTPYSFLLSGILHEIFTQKLCINVSSSYRF